MNGKKGKAVPGKAVQREDEKRVRAPEQSLSRTPSWRFSTVDLNGPFAWPKSEQGELDILQKLHGFDSMAWPEIEGPDHHAIDVGKLSGEARKRLEQIGQDDISEVFSFHFSGKSRIIGIRDGSAVKLLWWDAEHQVCPSPKKHT
ncbi:hypothetical protein SBC1_24840 [Caballeronia sp. SBC1]|uniref:hypothetical protein n=1 Tax=Caballeronia sp. SBC1 TaxID=2705548 RepID=UPI00140D6BF1|nr:hypothetical protein [Caballeronia sp. SBC1]QIN62469.1 hypothetical protein SBC1_24840 [Caballeronia sp. SBC1]